MKIKAMVAKVDQDQATMVVVTEDRQFKRVPLPEEVPALGSTIEITLPPEKQQIFRKFSRLKWLATAAVLLLVLTAGLLNVDVSPVAAYVTLDMKPSVQLGVDQQGKVITSKALNSTGQHLLKQVDLKQKDVYRAVQEIMQEASSDGYFDPNRENLVMANVALVSAKPVVQVENEKIRNIIRAQMSARHYAGYVVVSQAEKAQWEAAQKAGYTVNHMLLSAKASEQGVSLKPETLGQENVLRAIKEAHVSIPKLFPKESCKVTWSTQSAGEKTTTAENSVSPMPSSGSGNDNYQAPHQMNPGEMPHAPQTAIPDAQHESTMMPAREPDYGTDWHSSYSGGEGSPEMPESGMHSQGWSGSGSGMHH